MKTMCPKCGVAAVEPSTGECEYCAEVAEQELARDAAAAIAKKAEDDAAEAAAKADASKTGDDE